MARASTDLRAREHLRTVAEGLHDHLPRLPPAERRVAALLLAGDPLIGLEPVATLAAHAGTSAPTVLRLLDRLGFESYPRFQERVKQEIRSRLSSPVEKYPGHERVGLLALMQESLADAVRQTWTRLPPGDLARAVKMLADQDRRIILVGGRFSGYIAEYLAAQMQLVRPGVLTVPPSGAGRRAFLLDVDHRTTVVAFDYRRYQADTVAFGSAAVAAAAALILFTDQYLSPLAADADLVLATDVDTASPFDVLTPAVALVEALVVGLIGELGDQPRRRMARLESFGPAPARERDAR